MFKSRETRELLIMFQNAKTVSIDEFYKYLDPSISLETDPCPLMYGPALVPHITRLCEKKPLA